jgi:hypothetical protein
MVDKYIVCQNCGKKRVLDLSVRLFWYFFFRQAAGILLKLRWNFGIIGLEVCRSGSVKCIGENPVYRTCSKQEYFGEVRMKNPK